MNRIRVANILLAGLMAASSLWAKSAAAFIPVFDAASTTNSINDFLEGLKNTKLVTDATKFVGKTSSTIGDAYKSTSEFVTANKKKIEEKAQKLKEYEDKAEEYKKEYDEYKKMYDDGVAQAKKYKAEAEGYIEEGKEALNETKETVADAKETAVNAKEIASSKVDNALNKAGISTANSSQVAAGSRPAVSGSPTASVAVQNSSSQTSATPARLPFKTTAGGGTSAAISTAEKPVSEPKAAVAEEPSGKAAEDIVTQTPAEPSGAEVAPQVQNQKADDGAVVIPTTAGGGTSAAISTAEKPVSEPKAAVTDEPSGKAAEDIVTQTPAEPSGAEIAPQVQNQKADDGAVVIPTSAGGGTSAAISTPEEPVSEPKAAVTGEPSGKAAEDIVTQTPAEPSGTEIAPQVQNQKVDDGADVIPTTEKAPMRRRTFMAPLARFPFKITAGGGTSAAISTPEEPVSEPKAAVTGETSAKVVENNVVKTLAKPSRAEVAPRVQNQKANKDMVVFPTAKKAILPRRTFTVPASSPKGQVPEVKGGQVSALMPVDLYGSSSINEVQPLAFASLLSLPDNGTDANGTFILPKILAMYCGLDSKSALKKGAMDECLVKLNDADKNPQIEEAVSPRKVFYQGKKELAAVYIAEAYKAQNDTRALADKVLDSIDLAPAPDETDIYTSMVEMNKAVVVTMNGLLKIYSSRLALNAYDNYEIYKFATPEEAGINY